jgi:hypothetical protein
LLKAFATDSFSSKVMRVGLFHMSLFNKSRMEVNLYGY